MISFAVFYGCNKENSETKSNFPKAVRPDSLNENIKSKVTFVELGSVNCIPCKMMQPVMDAIEKEFGDQIHIVFHDVRKDPEAGRKFGINLIPTQVFLDSLGNECFRHEGYFPKEEIEKLLVEKGLKILKHVEIEK
jgi:thioredoxin 1